MKMRIPLHLIFDVSGLNATQQAYIIAQLSKAYGYVFSFKVEQGFIVCDRPPESFFVTLQCFAQGIVYALEIPFKHWQKVLPRVVKELTD